MPVQKITTREIVLFIITAVLICIGKYYHEPWMDEWRNMSIPLEAQSLQQLYELRSYESHPMTYYLILFVIKNFATGYKAMFALHGLAAIGVLYLLIFKSPFNFFSKIILCCSYYFIYETLIFNRQYVFMLLCLFGLLYIIQAKKPLHWYVLVAVPFIHLHVYAWLLIVPLSIYYLLEVSTSKPWLKYSIMAFLVINCGLAYYTAIPPNDSSNSFTLKPLTSSNILIYLRYYLNGFIAYINPLHPNNDIAEFGPKWVTLIASLFIYLATNRAIKDNHLKRLYVLTFIFLTLFNFNYQACAVRHTSFYYFNWLSFLWLDVQKRNAKTGYIQNMPIIFFILMAYQCTLGIYSWIKDYKRPYSESENVAAFINKNFKQGIPVISYYTFAIDAPAACLGRPVFALHCMHHHLYYNQKISETSCDHCTQQQILKQLQQARVQLGPSVLLICKSDFTNWLKDSVLAQKDIFNATALKSFDNGIERSENYELLELK
jgi:hypothetical protein